MKVSSLKIQEDLYSKRKKGSLFLKKTALKKAIAKVDESKVKKIGKSISKKDMSKMVKFYNEVIKDGRYIKEFKTNPEKVAKKLNYKLPKSIFEGIREVGGISSGGGAVSSDVELVAVAVIVIILVADSPENVIIDRSGFIKY